MQAASHVENPVDNVENLCLSRGQTGIFGAFPPVYDCMLK